MHNKEYIKVIMDLGLSLHPVRFEKRKQKYPQHFKQKPNGKWYITKEYAQFLKDCKNLGVSCIVLKGGDNE